MVTRTVPDVPNDVLRSMYDGRTTLGAIGPVLAEGLYRTVRREAPRSVVEVGMACGASTIAILTALEANGGEGQLISVDPFQHQNWHGQGVENVVKARLAHRHRLVEEFDYLALGDLLRQGLEVDFAYIDGRHNFDYTLLDFFFLDKMLRVGGLVGFNDCHYRAVEKVASFVMSHRRYEEEDIGLPPRRIVRAQWHRLIGRWVNPNDRYFRKRESWEPDPKYYAAF